jgi:fluoride exporter
MPTVFAVAIGGALGSAARYGADRVIEARASTLFPWSTFAINVTGCLLIGYVSAALVDRHHLPAWLRVGLVMGVVGGYTTFSTFAQEALDLDRSHHIAVSLAYIVGSVALGIAAVLLGTRLGRLR